MSIHKVNPETVAPPVANYSHLVVVPPGKRLLVLAGQLGIRPDGALPEAVEDQFDQALQNVVAIVQSEGGSADDICKLTLYYAQEPKDRTRHRAALRATFGERGPAMTFLLVAGLADPRYKVEVDAIAAVA